MRPTWSKTNIERSPAAFDLMIKREGGPKPAPRARRLKRLLDRLDVDRLIVGSDRKPCRVRLDLGLVESIGFVDQVVLADILELDRRE